LNGGITSFEMTFSGLADSEEDDMASIELLDFDTFFHYKPPGREDLAHEYKGVRYRL
jgi:hypothetical protein